MNYREVLEQIPAEYRREILLTNAIATAQANRGDASMSYLFTVWKDWIEPDTPLDFSCGLCLERIVNGWVRMQSTMVEMEQENSLYDTI